MMLKTASATKAYKHLCVTISNYQGYENQNTRTHTDKTFRRFMLTQARTLLKDVNTLSEQPENTGPIHEKIEKLKLGIESVSEGLKSPTYLGSSFFQTTNNNREKLLQLYECENAMVHDTLTLQSDIESGFPAGAPVEIEGTIIHIQNFIDNFTLHQFERESLLLE